MSTSAVQRVRAWEALDSRGHPTVAVRLELRSGAAATVCAPAGASAGRHEARELRDGGSRYGGRGVRTAVQQVLTALAPAVTGVDVVVPGAVDAELRRVDPSPGFAVVGANAVVALSVAAECAAADHEGTSLARRLRPRGPLPLPMPMVNIVSGGAHADAAVDLQDVLAVPLAAASWSEAVEWSAAVRQATAAVARRGGHRHTTLVADEGGLGVELGSNREALDLVVAGIEAAGLVPGEQVGLAVDVAASQLLGDGGYRLAREGRLLSSTEMVAEVAGWARDLPLVSVEDPLGEDDWDGWCELAEALPAGVQLLGDDLFVTQQDRLERGLVSGAADAVLVKVNQNGLVSDSRRVHDRALAVGWRTVVSARSGDTEDSWLTDLAVGWGASQIKVGSTHRSERTAKWNRGLELEAVEETVFAPDRGGFGATEEE